MRPERAHELLRDAHPHFPRFYGPASDLDFGVGLILSRLAYPTYVEDEQEFATVLGLAYIVSHECDIDPRNDRPFNDHAVICPIIPLEVVLQRYLAGRTDAQIRAFIDALAKSRVDRAAYIPTIADVLPYGGILYFSALTSTHVHEFSCPEVSRTCAVSVPGLQYVDARLHQAILKRPKAQLLPMADDMKLPEQNPSRLLEKLRSSASELRGWWKGR